MLFCVSNSEAASDTPQCWGGQQSNPLAVPLALLHTGLTERLETLEVPYI